MKNLIFITLLFVSCVKERKNKFVNYDNVIRVDTVKVTVIDTVYIKKDIKIDRVETINIGN